MRSLIDKIRSVDLNVEDFGFNAHKKMSHTGRQFHPQEGVVVKDAAVMHLIYPKKEDYYFSLIRRSSRNPNDKHGGQVGLAGGAREKLDLDLRDTAIRELHEEIGVNLSKDQIVKRLSPLYIPVSGFNVHPFLAVIEEEPVFVLQEEEVDYLIEVPMKDLFDKRNKAVKTMNINQKFALKNVPHYNFFNHIVWGATAMMLSELEALLVASDHPLSQNEGL